MIQKEVAFHWFHLLVEHQSFQLNSSSGNNCKEETFRHTLAVKLSEANFGSADRFSLIAQ